MDQITVERTDSSPTTEDQSHVGGKVIGDSDCYVVECLMPEEEVVIEEEEEDDVYIIELSNPEEEEENYKFTMTINQSLHTEQSKMKHLAVKENQRAPAPFGPQRPRRELSQKRKMEEEMEEEELVSNKRILEIGDYEDVMEINPGSGKKLECHVCPPGRFFKQPTGLAAHLRAVHRLDMKSYLCTTCNQTVRSQTKLDAHTRYHAKQGRVFTCPICSAETENKTEFRGPKWKMRIHLENQHPGVIPDCDICDKSFNALSPYLTHQLRHISVSPFYCAKCQIYETTERGLSMHIRNHEEEERSEAPPPTSGAKSESSETDDSDF